MFSAKILLFYVIFYAVLVGFFAALLAVFYQTLDTKTPKWQQESSLIGNNPGTYEISETILLPFAVNSHNIM